MTYGVDECRICGALMTSKGPDAMQRYLDSLTLKKPTMSQKEWRAAGFKAMPTPYQMGHVQDGCCYKCRFPIAVKSVRQNYFIISAVAFFFLVLIVLAVFGASFT